MSDIAGNRLSRLRARMAETDTDLVAVGPGSHMQWLLGLNPHGDERPVMALVTADHAGVLMPLLNADAARAQCADVPFFTWSDADGPQAALKELLTAVNATGAGLRVVLDEMMRTDFSFLLLDHLTQPVHHRFTDDTVGALRAEKDAEEHRLLRESARLNDTAFDMAFGALRTGMSEIALRDLIVAHYKANGAEPAFCIVAFGANSAFPHHHPGNDTLVPEMAVLIDTGCRLNGYPSDMTRCAWYGETPAPEFTQVAEVVERAVQAAQAAARPDTLCSAVDHAARQVITDAGYGAAFSHRTGHGLGVDVHEPPYIAANSTTPLAQGNVFSIEPGIYLKDAFGIRLEDVVYLHADRAEPLSGMARTVPQLPVRG
ncbi:M24 family metallopeptidase [Sulfitobacter albidus]|uniref:M24 family metallopeptidase n=1 Tax=Sulfitobacter albidus TaxID=2829501 RepID=A0A975PN08_9RHOB|nr:M24 family metallopeptidase [Sulfitobacter albidus]QUJ76805.1 M24 family metallopeptidase [Sulfitobacter albidus]